jgi:hypothetical protein
MTTKPAPMAFQPAPRPQSRVSPEQTRELAEATRDLGFGRTTSTPDGDAVVEAQSTPALAALTPRTPRTPAKAPKPEAPAVDPTEARMATLKVAIPDGIWNKLRHEALNRRVTVKYLVLEALAAKGYDLDLATIAEDGRRLR